MVFILQRLVERFGDSLFKIGESDSGRKLKVTMKEYLEYSLFNRDDSPLYLFESNIEEHPEVKAMVNEYTVPKPLQRDFFVELVSLSVTTFLMLPVYAEYANLSLIAIAGREASPTTQMVLDRAETLRQ